jgi:uncharacterized protein YkwD
MKSQNGRKVVATILFMAVLLSMPATGYAANFRPIRMGQNAPTYQGCGGTIVPASDAGVEQQVVDLVNAERAGQGLPPFKLHQELIDAARYHAADMAQDNYFNHDSYDRNNQGTYYVCSWDDRIKSYYTPPGEPAFRSLAENIAGGQSTPQAVMNAWMNSSGHRANILSTSNWELGVGFYSGSGQYNRYWVQDFGRRSGVYPLVINNDAADTDSRSVSLYIYGDWEEIRLKNDDGDWGAWAPFQSSMAWELGRGMGMHLVSAEMRKGQETAASSDSIYLNADDSLPILGNLPDEINFTYSIPDESLLPATQSFQPMNVGGADTLAWRLDQQGDWFDVQPSTGSTPDWILVTPENFDPQVKGTFNGVIEVTVLDPLGVEGSPHSIQLTLRVVDYTVLRFFIPQALK